MKKTISTALVLLLLLSTTAGIFAKAEGVDNFGNVPEFYQRLEELFFTPHFTPHLSPGRMSTLLTTHWHMTEKDKLDSVKQFSDMDVHWSKNDVGALTHLEIINGFPDRTFRPNATLQLDQFLKLAIEAMGHQLEQGFEEYWAINHINMAFFEGLIREGEYDLDNHDRFKQPITRQEMARIMSRALLSRWIMPHYTELEIIEEEIIKDIRTVTNEFRHYIILAYSFGLLKGRTEGNFEPHAHLTRAEGATVITRFIDEDLRETIKPDLSHKKQVTLFTGHSRFIIGKDGVHHVWQTIYECKREPDIIDMLIMLEKNLDIGGGARRMGLVPFNLTASSTWYSDWDRALECSLSSTIVLVDAGVKIDVGGVPRQDHSVHVARIENLDLHLPIIKPILEYAFEDDFDELWLWFNETKEIVANGGRTPAIGRVINDRHVIVSGGKGVFVVNFSDKGGRLRRPCEAFDNGQSGL